MVQSRPDNGAKLAINTPFLFSASSRAPHLFFSHVHTHSQGRPHPAFEAYDPPGVVPLPQAGMCTGAAIREPFAWTALFSCCFGGLLLDSSSRQSCHVSVCVHGVTRVHAMSAMYVNTTQLALNRELRIIRMRMKRKNLTPSPSSSSSSLDLFPPLVPAPPAGPSRGPPPLPRAAALAVAASAAAAAVDLPSRSALHESSTEGAIESVEELLKAVGLKVSAMCYKRHSPAVLHSTLVG